MGIWDKNYKKQGHRRGAGVGKGIPLQIPLPRLELFYCRATFLEENPVTAIGAPDIHINLNLLFAPGALV
jgi:hypothetical protein